MYLVDILISPLAVVLPRKKTGDKKFILNLNNYRNTHFQILNQAKQIYKEQMYTQIDKLSILSKIAVQFILYPKTARLTDIPNVCTIHDKFFMDSLVEYNKLIDDNYKYYVETSYKFGSIDPINPRVDIHIYSVE